MTIIIIEDEVMGGFTSYLKEAPNVIAQGDTLDEARENLAKTMYDVIMSLEIDFL
jgi:predicted RNase H-like HicB family nuclease